MNTDNQNAADAAEVVKGDEPQEGGGNTAASLDGDKTEGELTVAQLMAKVKELEEEKAKTNELLPKLRKFEKENKAKAEAEMKAKGEYQKLYEEALAELNATKGQIRDGKVNSALEAALKEANVKSLSTAMRLLDKSQIEIEGDSVSTKSLAKAVKGLMESDPILFEVAEEKATAPSVKRSSEGTPVSGFDKEVRAAKTQKELEAVLRKYGKL